MSWFCSYVPGGDACLECPIPENCPNDLSRAFLETDFETFIQEAGGRYTSDDLQLLEKFFFRWQESVSGYNTFPKKRSPALKYRIIERYRKLTRTLFYTRWQ